MTRKDDGSRIRLAIVSASRPIRAGHGRLQILSTVLATINPSRTTSLICGSTSRTLVSSSMKRIILASHPPFRAHEDGADGDGGRIPSRRKRRLRHDAMMHEISHDVFLHAHAWYVIFVEEHRDFSMVVSINVADQDEIQCRQSKQRQESADVRPPTITVASGR